MPFKVILTMLDHFSLKTSIFKKNNKLIVFQAVL